MGTETTHPASRLHASCSAHRNAQRRGRTSDSEHEVFVRATKAVGQRRGSTSRDAREARAWRGVPTVGWGEVLLRPPQGGAVAVKSEAEGRRRRPRRLRSVRLTQNTKCSFERRRQSGNVEAPRAETRAKRGLEGGPNRRLGGGLLILPKGGAWP